MKFQGVFFTGRDFARVSTTTFEQNADNSQLRPQLLTKVALRKHQTNKESSSLMKSCHHSQHLKLKFGNSGENVSITAILVHSFLLRRYICDMVLQMKLRWNPFAMGEKKRKKMKKTVLENQVLGGQMVTHLLLNRRMLHKKLPLIIQVLCLNNSKQLCNKKTHCWIHQAHR